MAPRIDTPAERLPVPRRAAERASPRLRRRAIRRDGRGVADAIAATTPRRGSCRMTTPILELRGAASTFARQPDARRAHPHGDRQGRAAARGARRRGGGSHDHARRGRSASSANPAAASPRWRASSPGSIAPTAGEVFYRGPAGGGAEGQGAARLPAHGADDLPGPFAIARPAHARRTGSSARRSRSTGSCRRRRSTPRRPGADRGGARPGLPRPLPAPVLRRPAPAHRHRPGARGEAARSGVRRAGLGARRVDPGAGHQPLHGPARAPRSSPISS